MTFEEACARWLEEKAHKKSLDDDKSRIGFWLQHFAGMQLKDITETRIYNPIQKMANRRHEENWKLREEALRKKGYTHLAPNHLTEHAKQIDSIFGDCVPNLSHKEKTGGD